MSASGILLPPGFLLVGDDLPDGGEAWLSGGCCPLCKHPLQDDDRRASASLARELDGMALSGVERAAVLDVLRELARSGVDRDAVLRSLLARRSTRGLARFVPPGDVSGFLVLLIAMLALSNDLVLGWFRSPDTSTPEEDPERPKPEPVPSRSAWSKAPSLDLVPDLCEVVEPRAGQRAGRDSVRVAIDLKQPGYVVVVIVWSVGGSHIPAHTHHVELLGISPGRHAARFRASDWMHIAVMLCDSAARASLLRSFVCYPTPPRSQFAIAGLDWFRDKSGRWTRSDAW